MNFDNEKLYGNLHNKLLAQTALVGTKLKINTTYAQKTYVL